MGKEISGFNDDPVDGLFGLSFDTVPYNGALTPLHNAIRINLFLEPIFTVWLGNKVSLHSL